MLFPWSPFGRPHYAWIICLGGALSLFAVMGMGINVFSVYQPYIIQLNGFSNAQGSWITTTRSSSPWPPC